MIPNFINYKNLLAPFFMLLLVFQANAQDDVLKEADQMPFFTGCKNENIASGDKRNCSDKNLIRFISNELVYPLAAKEQEIEGTVYASFIVDERGLVNSPKLIRDIGGGCGEAALQVIRNMPSWEPGYHQGKPVKIQLNIPIHFSLKNDEVNEKARNYQINWGSVATQVSITKKELEKQLSKPLHVRDLYGDDKPIAELIFAYEKKRSYLEGSSAGKINDELKKIVNKCKKGGTFTITAVIQVKGEFIYVKRAFRVV